MTDKGKTRSRPTVDTSIQSDSHSYLRTRSPSRSRYNQEEDKGQDDDHVRPLFGHLHSPTYPPRSSQFSSTSIRRLHSLIRLPPSLKRIFLSPVYLVLVFLCVLLTFFFLRSDRPFDTGSPFPWENPPSSLIKLPEEYAPYLPDLNLPEILLSPQLEPLASQLKKFLLRPVLSYEESDAANKKLCPSEISDRLVNPDQYNGDGQFWREGVTPTVVYEKRASLIHFLAKHVEEGRTIFGAEVGQGQGIVLTGGNQDTTLRMITLLRHLNRLGVKLPVEVFHYPDELHEEEHREAIRELGATIREIQGVGKVDGVWKNWQIKGQAIIQSSFREVLYIDSDNIPLRDPSHLFSAPHYLNNGRAVFWPDLSRDHPDNAIWRLVGDTCNLREWTFESGQIVLDKGGNGGLNIAALYLAAGMMADRDFWFRMCGGDKDTFRWAWRMLDINLATSPRWMSALGFKNGFENGRFCGHTVLQYDLVIHEGEERERPLFVHSNLLKHLGSANLGRGKLFTHVKRMSLDASHEPTLNYAHAWVYNGAARGMCLDLDWHPLAYERLTDAEREIQKVEGIPVGQIEGGVFEGFEDAWFDEGGRIGGW
ncbi:hypothetical protein TREMEDRAFT_44612 [Tremella mesenterica DSM 1558]|uniref:uncharacterized protein n=1 Tax=Tremella mesenterica (strain ATCC 24925 / CBS 8224 / DSM 1558 / NBRC 9311 / NRRL Y-6157 / RJB 2259-6 / UBC 559-6) TaxID=578456 RepID=UPI0003F4A409|nr:uncharacterized protein TREMEDRAFT_44612 [Tremella mesenterica DSM 1558]EIW68172.1 hypothetical protein TREMEDRAFT_44612 [Tremella mesenterica DSM 1558]